MIFYHFLTLSSLPVYRVRDRGGFEGHLDFSPLQTPLRCGGENRSKFVLFAYQRLNAHNHFINVVSIFVFFF